MDTFDLNKEFISYSALLLAKKQYENTSKTILVTSQSSKLKGFGEFVDNFVYDRIVFTRKAGIEKPSSSKGIRKSFTYKRNCPFKVTILLKVDKFVVTSGNFEHNNHDIDEQTFMHYPEKLRLSADETTMVKLMLKADGNKKLVKAELMEKRGGAPVKLKSIHNLQTKFRLETEQILAGESELEKLLAVMLSVPNAKVRVLKTENNELLSIYFQNERMSALFEKYPEVVLFDATHKLNNRRMPLFLQLVIDGNGQTEVVSLWICINETLEIADAMLDAFKDFNPSWTKIQCFIGDKDFADRYVYRVKFPGVDIEICLFHVQQTFQREITSVKRGITAEEREKSLSILQRMCYSISEKQYTDLYNELIDLQLDEVTKYFNDNWHSIKDEWTLFHRNHHNNYLNRTNNRTERLNRELKSIGSGNANLLKFFDNIYKCISVMASEKDIKAVQNNMRIPRERFDDEIAASYQQFLTPFVFEKVLHEYGRRDSVIIMHLDPTEAITDDGIVISKNACSCNFFTAMKLPCRHIFAFYQQQNFDLFAPQLCAERWTKKYYNASHPALCRTDFVAAATPLFVQTIRAPDERDKFKSIAKITKDINCMAATLSTGHFTYVLEKLKKISSEMIESHLQSHEEIDDNENEQLFQGNGTSRDVPVQCEQTVDKVIKNIVDKMTDNVDQEALQSSSNQEVNTREETAMKSSLPTINILANEQVHYLINNSTVVQSYVDGPSALLAAAGILSNEQASESSVYQIPTTIPLQWHCDGSVHSENGIRNDDLSTIQYPFERNAQNIPADYGIGNDILLTVQSTSSNFVTSERNSPLLSNEQLSQATCSSFQFIAQPTLNAPQSVTVSQQHSTATQNSQPQENCSDNSVDPSSSTFMLVTSTQSKHIKNISLPTKNVAVGRPKGSKKTAIGLKRKINNGDNKTVFAQQSESIQAFRILGWLTNLNVDQILKKKVSYDDIVQDADMFQRLTNKLVTLRVIKKYCNSKCYMYLTGEVQRLQALKRLLCKTCHKLANQNALHCAGCLDWFHLKCAGVTKTSNNFFCLECV